ncbi:MAG: hypothetical protein ACXVNM_03605 [Bacteroidia bacterium]
MEQNTTTTETNVAAATRPTFLTVLCILSFIFGGIGIIFLVIALLGMGALTAGAAAIEGAGGTITQSAGPSIGLTWAWLIIGFVTALGSLFGVIKMWKLQKVGFFIYTACTVVSIIMGVVYSGFGFMSVLPLLFVILYGLNLKHLK